MDRAARLGPRVLKDLRRDRRDQHDDQVAHGSIVAAGRNARATSATVSAALMAVPKKKTSKSRRDKRRATHSIESVRVNLCPQCNSPKRPHHVCPTCGTYKGREVEALKLRAP